VLLALGMGVVAVLRLSGAQAPGQPASLMPVNLPPASTGTSSMATPGGPAVAAAPPAAQRPESGTPTRSAGKVTQPRTGDQALPELAPRPTQLGRMRHEPDSSTLTEVQTDRRNEQVRRDMIDRVCQRYNLPSDRCAEEKYGSDY
jgi:hypothetical protein